MLPPIYVAFYTPGRYAVEAARLRSSLGMLGLPHDIRQVEDRGSWVANTRYTAEFICKMLAVHDMRPVVYLDADAFVWKRPILFEAMTADVAVHWRQGKELLNGTAYFAPTDAAGLVATKYRDLIEANPDDKNEQAFLDVAIKKTPIASVYKLPPEYCWIHDIMAADIGDKEPVIEHLQASREADGHRSYLTDSRARRIATIEGMK